MYLRILGVCKVRFMCSKLIYKGRGCEPFPIYTFSRVEGDLYITMVYAFTSHHEEGVLEVSLSP